MDPRDARIEGPSLIDKFSKVPVPLVEIYPLIDKKVDQMSFVDKAPVHSSLSARP